MHAMDVEVGSAVGVGTDQDPSLGKMQTQQFDALLQRTRLATPERTQHKRRDLDTKYTIKTHTMVVPIIKNFMHVWEV